MRRGRHLATVTPVHPDPEATQAFSTEFALSGLETRAVAWVLPIAAGELEILDDGADVSLGAELGVAIVGRPLRADRRTLEAALAAALRQSLGQASGLSLETVTRNEFEARRLSPDPLRGLPADERLLVETLLVDDWLPIRRSPPQFRSMDDLLRDLAGGGGATWITMAAHGDAIFALLVGAAAIVIIQFATGVGESARAFGQSLFRPTNRSNAESDEA